MRKAANCIGLVTAVLVASLSVDAQVTPPVPRYTLLDIVVFGTWLEVDQSNYPPEVRSALQQHLIRWKTYEPRPRPTSEQPLLEMVSDARESYERRLVSAADPNDPNDPNAPNDPNDQRT